MLSMLNNLPSQLQIIFSLTDRCPKISTDFRTWLDLHLCGFFSCFYKMWCSLQLLSEPCRGSRKPLVSFTVPARDRQAFRDFVHTNSPARPLAPSHTHKQFCMAVLLGLFTLSRRPSVRQWNEWLFILEGWFNELDPQLLCVSTRNTETRPSPFLTPYTRQGAGTPWLHPVGRVTQGARRRPSKGFLLIYKRHLAEAVHGPFSCSTSPFLLSSPITSPP